MAQVIHALGEKKRSSLSRYIIWAIHGQRRGIRVIEFNARLGDPEAINVMTLLEETRCRFFMILPAGNWNQIW